MNRFFVVCAVIGGLISGLTACSENPKTAESQIKTVIVNGDSAQIAASLHQFYTW